MPEKKQDEDDAIFVVTTNPLANTADNKRRVRSAAALKSWPERRKKIFEQNQGKKPPNQGGFVLDFLEPSVAGPSNAQSANKKRRTRKNELAQPAAGSQESEALAESRLLEVDEEPLFEKCTRASVDLCSCAHCRTERTYHFGPSGGDQTSRLVPSPGKKRTVEGHVKVFEPRGGDLAMLTPPSSPGPSPLTMVNNVNRAEPFSQYPVPYHSWFDYVLHHMMNVFAPRGWPALKITNEEGLKWEWFMTQHALAEPALFYVRLLFATGDLIRLKTLQPEVSYWLQSLAVQAINEALSDPKRATSDALILAVGRIALHETLYGDKEAAKIMHRPAQKRMIKMRGGMKELQFPELVKRLMRWADTVMAKQTGTDRILEDDEKSENFSMKQHVEVLEEWKPGEGTELSKKIRISDLLSPSPESATPP